MIVGTLEEVARPYVRCRLTLPRFGIVARMMFLVDTGADATYLHPRDSVRMGVPFDLLGNRLPSLMGRDVIRRWRIDYDPMDNRLEFTVRDADFALSME